MLNQSIKSRSISEFSRFSRIKIWPLENKKCYEKLNKAKNVFTLMLYAVVINKQVPYRLFQWML